MSEEEINKEVSWLKKTNQLFYKKLEEENAMLEYNFWNRKRVVPFNEIKNTGGIPINIGPNGK